METKLREGFQIETSTDAHAIVARRNLLSLVRGLDRYVVSVDEHGRVTMIPAEPVRS